MSTQPPPPLEGQPASTTAPCSAEPARTPFDSGAPKGVARQGVLSALRPDPRQPAQPAAELVFYGLHIIAEPEWRIAVTAACPCGFRRQVRGRAKVAQTIEDYTRHKETCPRHTGLVERRHAA
ncbi:hypothetical protein [Streptomyces sp. NPDC048196]|uniref:hypothetical protein n=1 Tax=Streptomyces sp. NPDC048196 TaxID=3154712 RepID=UPI0033EE25E7